MKPELLHEGVLCQLKMGRWDARVRLPKSKFGKELPTEIVRGMQDVIEDRTLLKDLATIRRSAKGLLQRSSLPFPVDGVFWVPKEKVPELDDAFKAFKKERRARLNKLLKNIDKMKSNFKKKYPDFYEEKYYPDKAKLESKFYFHWNFFQMTIPDVKAGVLSPEMVKKETAKLRGMVKQMEEMTVNLVGNMLFARVQKLAKQCDNEKVNAGTVSSIDRFIQRWDDLWRDRVDQKQMKMVMSRLKKEMKSATAERLKDNDDFRTKMQGNLESIMDKIKAVPDFKLKRKLDV